MYEPVEFISGDVLHLLSLGDPGLQIGGFADG
jgi:hypothetical protein